MEYEVVREIKNLCPNNQMRDVFIYEVETDDPETYVRQMLKGNVVELSAEQGPAEGMTIYAVADGLMQKFIFTPL